MSKNSPRSFDDLRREYPTLGFAIYAYDPAGPVILEVHSDGEVYPFQAPTAAEAIETAFPAPPATEPTPTNIFD